MTIQGLAQEQPTPVSPLYLVEEINHRVVNEFSEAILALSVAAEEAPALARGAIFRAMGRLKAHTAAHRALQAPSSCHWLNLAEHLERVCASLSNAALADSCVHLAVIADEIWLDAGQCWRIGLIVAELVRNAARHGLAGGSGAVGVRVVKRPTSIDCYVHDNGGSTKPATSGRGLKLIRIIAEDLGGTVATSFTPTGGVACLSLPHLAE